MTEQESDNLQVVRAYLSAVAAGATGDALARHLTDDVIQVEFPNRLNPNGGRSDLATLLERAKRVPLLMASQSFEIRSAIAQGATVAVEATWTGVLATQVGTLPAGATMTAHFAMFFELREGRICSQRNYDCFEPW